MGFQRERRLGPAARQPILAQDFSEAPADLVLAERCRRWSRSHPCLAFQLFYGAVEQKVRSDFESLRHSKEHRERRLSPCAFEERRVRARDAAAERKFLLRQIFLLSHFLENL